MGALALRPADLRELDGEARVQDVRLGEVLGYADPKKVRTLIRRHQSEMLDHGVLTQSESKMPGAGSGRPERHFLLNEGQAILVAMFSRTDRAAEVRRQIVAVFLAWRHGHLVPTSVRPRRKGFGRRSTIEMLPSSCDEDVNWANEALRAGKAPQVLVLEQFNARLAGKGVPPVSKGAFSRYSVRLAVEMRAINRAAGLTSSVIERLGPGDRSDGIIAATEIVKNHLLEAMPSTEGREIKDVERASLTLQRLSNVAAREVQIAKQERTGAGGAK